MLSLQFLSNDKENKLVQFTHILEMFMFVFDGVMRAS